MMKLYLLRQPETLESLAIDKLAVWIASQAEMLLSPISELHDTAQAEATLSRHIEKIQHCLKCNMPRMLHDVLLSKTIIELTNLSGTNKCEESAHITKSKTKVIRRMVETLFTDKLTCLLLHFNQFTLIRESLIAKSYMLSGLIRLECLDFDSRNNERVLDTDLIPLLQELHSLKYLTIKHVCTDNILKCIVSNCTLIEELDVQSSYKINNNSMNILVQLHHLKSINLANTRVYKKGIETLMSSCKNIEHVVIPNIFYITGNNVHILKHFAFSKEYDGKLFKLKSYISRGDTLAELQRTLQMFPLIQNLTVEASQPQNRGIRYANLMALISLHDLRDLTLNGYSYYSNQCKEALQVIGYNLEHLQLLHITQIDLNAIMDISQMCPNLQSLSLKYCTFTDQTSASLYTKDLEIQPFRNLKKLTLDTMSSFYIQEQPLDLTLHTRQTLRVMHEPASFLLSNCLNVEFIEFTRTKMLTEEYMLNILDKNPLTYLKELKIEVCVSTLQHRMTALTTFILDLIVRNCINQPQVIQSFTNKISPSPYINRHNILLTDDYDDMYDFDEPSLDVESILLYEP